VVAAFLTLFYYFADKITAEIKNEERKEKDIENENRF
jgi:hypothetical protein